MLRPLDRKDDEMNEITRKAMGESTSSLEPGGSTGEIDPSLVSRVMAEMGRRGGKIGGKRRLETLTPEQRRELALKAARKRWEKRKPLS